MEGQKQKTLEENFRQLNSHFKEIFSRIVPNGKGELKFVSKDVDAVTQKTNPTQFPDPTQIL